jgi:hypothetical protein
MACAVTDSEATSRTDAAPEFLEDIPEIAINDSKKNEPARSD